MSVASWQAEGFLPLGLSGKRGIVVACICLQEDDYISMSEQNAVHLASPDTYIKCAIQTSVGPSTLPWPHHNSSQIWAGITKFAPNMHPGTLSAGIENGGHWPWPSRSFWPFCLRILGNLACPHNNSSQIWARITKFAPNMHPGTLLVVIENGGHWPWPSRSFWPFWLRILGNSACLRDNSSQIWAGITKFAPNKHPGILLIGIEIGGHWPWSLRSFWPFWLGILVNLACLPETCNGFELESPNLPQICILGFSQMVLNMGSLILTFKVIWPSFRLKKLHSMWLLYTDLGWPRGATRPKLALVLIISGQHYCKRQRWIPNDKHVQPI